MLGNLKGFPNHSVFLTETAQGILQTSRVGGHLVIPSSCEKIPTCFRLCEICQQEMIVVVYLWIVAENRSCYRLIYLSCCSKAALGNDTENDSHTLSDSFAWKAFGLVFPCAPQNSEFLSSEVTAVSHENPVENTDTADWLVQLASAEKHSSSVSLRKCLSSLDEMLKVPGYLIKNTALPSLQLVFCPQTCCARLSGLDVRARILAEEYESRCLSGEEEEEVLDIASLSIHGSKHSVNSAQPTVWESEGYEAGDLEFRLSEKYQREWERSSPHVLRYHFGGKPLFPKVPIWNTREHLNSMEKGLLNPPFCRHCQAPCVFEFQLMPLFFDQLSLLVERDPTLTYLKSFLHHSQDCCSLLVFTCSADCISSSSSQQLGFIEKPVALCSLL